MDSPPRGRPPGRGHVEESTCAFSPFLCLPAAYRASLPICHHLRAKRRWWSGAKGSVRPNVPGGTEAVSGRVTVLCPVCLQHAPKSSARKCSLVSRAGRSCGRFKGGTDGQQHPSLHALDDGLCRLREAHGPPSHARCLDRLIPCPIPLPLSVCIARIGGITLAETASSPRCPFWQRTVLSDSHFVPATKRRSTTVAARYGGP
jgi:hypothetical protein